MHVEQRFYQSEDSLHITAKKACAELCITYIDMYDRYDMYDIYDAYDDIFRKYQECNFINRLHHVKWLLRDLVFQLFRVFLLKRR